MPQCHSEAFENQSSDLSEFPDICRGFFVVQLSSFMMFHGHFMRSLLVFRCLHWPSLWGLRLPPGFCILAVGRWAAPAAWHIFVKIFT
jgi:hypothetical protein